MTMKTLPKVLLIVLSSLAGLVVILALVAGGYILNNLHYSDWGMRGVRRAGFQEKNATINGTSLRYAEGPDNGPALLLIHGQTTDWQDYFTVLPELSRRFHVFAVDCHGHGGSEKDEAKYSANAMGRDFAAFITRVIGESAIVSGHSSGGLLAVWLAANAPESVSGVVLEDPPLFSCEMPRYMKTFAYWDTSLTCHNFLGQSAERDFSLYYIENCSWMKFFGKAQRPITDLAISYRKSHPAEPLKIFFFPPSMNESFRALDAYDPRFGDTFYDGSWNTDFDHAQALERIRCPAILIHASWQYDAQGILLAAMDGSDAARAVSLIRGCTLVEVKSGHDVHLEHPRDFIKAVEALGERLRNG
ncbi:MAG TPA: alpha/beta hydrolase [Spirochaetia bacterium]